MSFLLVSGTLVVVCAKTTGRLRTAILTGEWDLDDNPSPDAKITWEIAKAWDSALAAQGIIRPSSILGINKLGTLWALEDALCPSNLSNEFKIKRTQRKFPGSWERLSRRLRIS